MSFMLRFVIGHIDGKAYGLNANEMCVLEAIGRCCRNKDAKGWYASMQALADALPFEISYMTVDRAVKKLVSLGLIEKRENKSFFITQNVEQNPQIVESNTQNVEENPQIVENSPPLNNPPINNRIKENKNEETNPRAQKRNEGEGFFMKDFKFYIFWTAFHPSRDMISRKAQCRWLWEDVLDFSVKQHIMEELYQHEANGEQTEERNPYYYLRNFAPKVPHDWNGDHSIDKATAQRLIIAKYNGVFGSYTPEHVLLFKLEVAQDYKETWEAYLKYVMSDPNKKPIKYN